MLHSDLILELRIIWLTLIFSAYTLFSFLNNARTACHFPDKEKYLKVLQNAPNIKSYIPILISIY